jgi:hypothetical protein
MSVSQSVDDDLNSLIAGIRTEASNRVVRVV